VSASARTTGARAQQPAQRAGPGLAARSPHPLAATPDGGAQARSLHSHRARKRVAGTRHAGVAAAAVYRRAQCGRLDLGGHARRQRARGRPHAVLPPHGHAAPPVRCVEAPADSTPTRLLGAVRGHHWQRCALAVQAEGQRTSACSPALRQYSRPRWARATRAARRHRWRAQAPHQPHRRGRQRRYFLQCLPLGLAQGPRQHRWAAPVGCQRCLAPAAGPRGARVLRLQPHLLRRHPGGPLVGCSLASQCPAPPHLAPALARCDQVALPAC